MSRRRALLLVDGVVNLLLGVLLLLSPTGLADVLALPVPEGGFYPSLLGAVLVGIGAALLIERYGRPRGLFGLGIAGAIAINLCGGGVLVAWLTFGSLAIPARGHILLWAVAVLVLAIAALEVASGSWREPESCED